jgi:protein translocase subunit yajC
MITIFLVGGSCRRFHVADNVNDGCNVRGILFPDDPSTNEESETGKNFQESLKVGARVVTTSGMHGRIAQIQDDGVVIETLSGKLKFEKAAISREFTQQRFPDSADDKK